MIKPLQSKKLQRLFLISQLFVRNGVRYHAIARHIAEAEGKSMHVAARVDLYPSGYPKSAEIG
ncbi:MAG: hypothetical protein FJY35_10330 [Betaproteobacteria bacterium]|nr:hypothetical protein [Betaproteobacteria bacterium]